ncbi:MAG: hypothetical protein HLUCCX21_01610 [Porphyrobacter sp. HL-46]|nr:MAG: hypothetical protein HLUCCX21_01610 [Porphyrobacter sp. HL-46]
MSPDMFIPIISSIGWLVVVGAALASHRLQWSQMIKLALVWLAIFLGLFVLVEWFMMTQDTAGTPI